MREFCVDNYFHFNTYLCNNNNHIVGNIHDKPEYHVATSTDYNPIKYLSPDSMLLSIYLTY